MNKKEEIMKFSNPSKVALNANKYFGKKTLVYLSSRKDKKYMIQDESGKWVHFGGMGNEDFTKHNDEQRRERYLKRASAIKGDWKDDKYSANKLAMALLWAKA